MNAIFSQEARLGQLKTVLGKDVLVLLRFTGSDHVNGLFDYTVECLSTEPNIDFDGIVGTHASVMINSQDDGPRHFDGIVTEAKWAGVGENGNKYQLILKPWIWLAGRRRNQRIFHNMTVVQIIEKLLQPYSDLGDPALQTKLVEDYPVLEYTVQHRESDMDFAIRLMERFGISYHFVHKEGSHTLVMTDSLDHHDAVAGGERVYKPYDGHHNTEHEHFWGWFPERRLTTGAMRLTDYNFKTPHAAMETDRIGEAKYEQGQIESYDYPGDYLEQPRGKDVVGLRTRQERGQDARHRAIGDCTSLGSGMTLTLTGDHVDGVKGADYLCLSASHSYVSDAYGTMDSDAQKQASDGYAYTGEYVLMPVTSPLAPERKTHMPRVQGPQTAVVVGEGEIDCDEYGRILVHFHWDLEKAYSMRCRVSQNWASKGWGGMVIPRIGMEVIVEHLEGDPDKPIVTGCVYNGHNDVPYELPKHKTRSTFKTDTHQGQGFNELRFEDENNKEEIFIHAQKDRNEKTLNNHTERVDNNWVQSIGHNKRIEVSGSHAEAIAGNLSLSVGPSSVTDFVAGTFSKLTNGIGQAGRALGFPGMLNPGEGNFNVVVEKTKTEVVGIASTETVGVSKEILSGSRVAVRAGTIVELDGGQSVDIEADDTIILSCGKSSIIMDAEGNITFYGTKARFEMEEHFAVNSARIDLN